MNDTHAIPDKCRAFSNGYLWATIALIFLAAIVAIGSFLFLHNDIGPNRRYYITRNITLAGPIVDGRFDGYDYFEFGRPSHPLDVHSPLQIQLPDGDVVSIGNLKVGQLKLLHNEVYGNAPSFVSTDWQEGSEWLNVGGYAFLVNGDKLLALHASTVALDSTVRLKNLKEGYDANIPRIGRTDSEYDLLLRMPFTETQAVYLFGNPDRNFDNLEK